MSFQFKTPALGENIKSGKIAKILVQPGDEVHPDQALFELETDKAVIEIPATMHARISELLVREGDEVLIAQPLLIYEPAADSTAPNVVTKPTEPPAPFREPAPASTTESKPVPPTPPANTTGQLVPIQLPGLGENITGGVVVQVLVNVGETIEPNQGVLELETDKAVIEVPAEIAGTIREILVKVGEQIKVGQKIVMIEARVIPAVTVKRPTLAAERPTPVSAMPSEKPPTTPAQPLSPPTPVLAQVPAASLVPAAPSVRRFAREIGININEVPGTGSRGRISIEDVKNYSKFLNQQKSTAAGVLPGGIEVEKLPDFAQWGEIERQTMNKIRQTTARHLSYAWATIPQVTQFDRADITELEKMRQQYAPTIEAAGGKLTITAILLKIVASALKKFPEFNASIDLVKNEIIYKKYYNIGVAVDTEWGLLVPVVVQVDQKNITELAVELTRLSEKARQRKLTIAEMQGGNFSISNLGGIGGTGFSPIVNAPEVAILGVSRARVEAVHLEGQFVPRLLLPLSLSYDHRLIDGADGARFLKWIITALEQPFQILLEG